MQIAREIRESQLTRIQSAGRLHYAANGITSYLGRNRRGRAGQTVAQHHRRSRQNVRREQTVKKVVTDAVASTDYGLVAERPGFSTRAPGKPHARSPVIP